MNIIRYQDLTIAIFAICVKIDCQNLQNPFFSCMRDCNTEFDETSVDKSNTPESDTTINNTSDVNNEEEK